MRPEEYESDVLTLNELYAAILDWIYGEDDSYANG
jgi:hypothetical protein